MYKYITGDGNVTIKNENDEIVFVKPICELTHTEKKAVQFATVYMPHLIDQLVEACDMCYGCEDSSFCNDCIHSEIMKTVSHALNIMTDFMIKKPESKNIVEIKGIVTKDAEMKYDPARNDYVMTFVIAETGIRKPCYYTVEFVGRNAKRMVYNITKGRTLRVKGECNLVKAGDNAFMKIIHPEIRFHV